MLLLLGCKKDFNLFEWEGQTSNRYRIYENSLYGFINGNGEVVIKPEFEIADNYYNGLAVIGDNWGPYGAINTNGDLVIEPIYRTLGDFSENGLAPAEFSDWLYGYINRNNDIMIPSTYSYAKPFYNGIAIVLIDSKRIFIDNKGVTITSNNYEAMGNFNDERAMVENENGEIGFIDPHGNLVVNFFNAGPGLVPMYTKGLIALAQGGGFGFYDIYGNQVIDSKFRSASYFSGGLAAVSIDFLHYGYINTSCKWIVKPTYLNASAFSDGLAAVSNQSYSYGYINSKGNLKIDHQFSEAGPFIDGLALVRYKDGRRSYINKKGEDIYIFKQTKSNEEEGNGTPLIPNSPEEEVLDKIKRGIF
jgi:hypothetical protein